MSDERPGSITLTITSPWGETFACAVSVEAFAFMETYALEKSPAAGFPGEHAFTDVVTMMRRRAFRKGVLIAEAQRLAGQIAERLEDREGWHGADRQETANRIAPYVSGVRP